MTDDDRESGRWQGNVSARLAAVEVHVSKVSDKVEHEHHGLGAAHSQIQLLRQRLMIIWTALAFMAASLGSVLLNRWSAGGF